MTPPKAASPSTEAATFNGLGIAPKLLESLAINKYVHPTPIQLQSIPVAIEGKDMVGIAQTGTGKTLAFGIPMLQRVARMGGKGLVLLPTRELALQVDETLHKIGKAAGLRTAILIGGASMRPQVDALRKNPHVIVATPGRLIDHLEHKTANLEDVSVLVLDEADRMLDMGFQPQINRILRTVPSKRQTMLFSATMPHEIVAIAQKYMTSPTRIEVARAGEAAANVSQELFVVQKHAKVRLLEKLLNDHKGSVLVFTRTKFGAKRLTRDVIRMGHPAAEIHSDRSLGQRKDALAGFKNGKYRVLVATDIAARGIDVTGIELVVNFDVPENAEDYVHRIGRTGRAGMTGKAITFAMPDQGSEVRDIERLIRKVLNISPMPTDLPAERPQQPREYGGASSSHGSSRYGNSSGGSRGGYGAPRSQGSSYGAKRPGTSYGDTRTNRSASYGDTRSTSYGDTRGTPSRLDSRAIPPRKFNPRKRGPIMPDAPLADAPPKAAGEGRTYMPGLDDDNGAGN